MKKYKLKKDLPTVLAGREFYLNAYGDLVACPQYHFGIPLQAPEIIYSRQTLERYPSILKDWFEEIPEKPRTVWDLKEGDTYYYSLGHDIFYARWRGDMTDIEQLELGNVFLTEEEAEKELARRKAYQILLRDTKGFKPSKSDDYFHYRICWHDGELRVLCDRDLETGILFGTRGDATDSMNNHEKEWKTYLGVE